jgi:hypothetical protein
MYCPPVLVTAKLSPWPQSPAHAAGARALDLLVQDWDDATLDDADVLPRRLGHVEVGAPRAAPPAVGQRVVGWAQVGGGDRDGLMELPGLQY